MDLHSGPAKLYPTTLKKTRISLSFRQIFIEKKTINKNIEATETKSLSNLDSKTLIDKGRFHVRAFSSYE